MSYFESKDPLTEKAPEHQKAALEAHKKELSEMGKTLIISPFPPKFNITITKVTPINPASYSTGVGRIGKSLDGYKIIFITKDKTLFNIILNDVRKIPGRRYNSADKYWWVPDTSKTELDAFIFKYSLDSKLDYPIEDKKIKFKVKWKGLYNDLAITIYEELKDMGIESEFSKIDDKDAVTTQIIYDDIEKGKKLIDFIYKNYNVNGEIIEISEDEKTKSIETSSSVDTIDGVLIPSLVDITKIKVGEIVNAHWVHEGKIYSTEVRIAAIIRDSYIQFKSINNFKLWDMDERNTPETLFEFKYPFTLKHYLTYKISPDILNPWEDKEHILSKIKDIKPWEKDYKSSDFKYGDIVITNWESYSGKSFSADAVIVRVQGDVATYDVKLLKEIPSYYTEGSVISFTLPFNKKQWLEHKYPIELEKSVHKNLDRIVKPKQSAKDFLAELSKSLLLEVWKPPILSEKEVEEHTEKLEKAISGGIESQVEALEKAYIDDAKAAGRKQVDINDVAKLIKHILNLYYPKTKFSVRTSKYSIGHIDVTWELGPTWKHVYKIVGKYRDKTFDGSTDSTSYLDTPWNNDSVSPQRTVPTEFWLKRAAEIAESHGEVLEPRTYEQANKIFIDSKSLWDIVSEEINNTDY